MTKQRELWLLLTLAGIQFSTILDFMIMMPLGPQFTQLFGISDAQFGLLVSVYMLAAGLSSLAASFFIDRFGRKSLLLFLYTGFGLSAVACALAPSFGLLMAARVCAGAFGGVMTGMGQTIVGDVIPFERRGRAMSIIMTAFSLASVAGLPAGLWLAAHWSWHAPFIAIALLCAVLGVFAAVTLPPLKGHLHQAAQESAWQRICAVLADANHRKAFLYTAALMFAGFTLFPFLAINAQYGIGLAATQIPYLYLCGGLGALLSARFIGQLTDRWGKVQCFRLLAGLSIAPIFVITLLPWGTPFGLVLVVFAMFMVCMSGRNIPGMAIVTSAADPRLRGTFMTLNSSVQSAAMGLASMVGGLLMRRDSAGHVQDFWLNGLVTFAGTLLVLWLVGRMDLHQNNRPPQAGI